MKTDTPQDSVALSLEFEPHQIYMNMAIEQARAAGEQDEVPVGAIIVRDSRVVAAAYNQRESLNDPTAHAEIIALTQAAESVGGWRLEACTMYVTLEPCLMCAGAILQARVPNVVFGASDPKGGAVTSMFQVLNDQRLNHQCHVIGGVDGDRCGQMLTDFFEAKRRAGKK